MAQTTIAMVQNDIYISNGYLNNGYLATIAKQEHLYGIVSNRITPYCWSNSTITETTSVNCTPTNEYGKPNHYVISTKKLKQTK